MNDEEWDKVRKYSPRGVLFSSGLIIIPVLECQCQEQHVLVQRGVTDLQCESRRWCLYHDIVDCSKFVNFVFIENMLMRLFFVGHCAGWEQYTLFNNQGSRWVSLGFYKVPNSMCEYSSNLKKKKKKGLHLMKCLAGTQGSKARVNAVLPGLLLTEWVRTKTRRNPCIIANHHGN